MNAAACAAPLKLPELLDYWLDGLDAAAENAVEEHLLGCAECSASLQGVVALAEGVKRIVRTGGVGAVLTSAFVERLKQSGVRVREYRMEPSEGVRCTITPEDDVVVAHLRASLEGVERLDLLMHSDDDRPARLEDVPFDVGAGGIVLAPRAAYLRGLGTAVQRVRLLAVEGSGERSLGEYTFRHTPHGE